MDSSRVLQPHVCCVGNPVAGNPTQFVMSRAARNCSVDWRFFTSQVAESNFEAAMRGVQALGLAGAIILPPFQRAIIPFLDTLTQSAHCLQRVTIARMDGSSWLGDNFLGSALWQTVLSRGPTMKTSAPESEPNTEEPFRVLLAGKSGAKELESLHQCLMISMPKSCQLELFVQENSQETTVQHSNCHALILESEIDNLQLKALLQLNWVSNPAVISLDPVLPNLRKSQREELVARGFQRVEQVEWMAMEAVANFAFLTGVTPPLDAVRESLEEYLQW